VTKAEAIEKCVKAMLRNRSVFETQWKESATDKDFAEKMVICLRELGLLSFQ
jgi:hypothetical protein